MKFEKSQHQESTVENQLIIGSKHYVEIIDFNGVSLHSHAVNGFVSTIENIYEFIYVSTVNDTSYLLKRNLQQVDLLPFGEKPSSRTIKFDDRIILFRDTMQPAVLEVKNV